MNHSESSAIHAIAVSADDSTKAKSIARKLFSEIDTLESEIVKSKRIEREIENRGIWKRIRSSSSKDLVAVAKTQNIINERLANLTQETIRLNLLSYAGLVSLMDEMRRGIVNGFTDANGQIVHLGAQGKDLAEAATEIISGILDSSMGTQNTIAEQTRKIERLGHQLVIKDQLDTDQDEAIAALAQHIEDKNQLDFQQSNAIANLEDRTTACEVRITHQLNAVDKQKDALEKLAVQVALLGRKLLEAETALQKNQGQTAGQLTKLIKSLQYWRWGGVASISVLLIWQLTAVFR